MSSIPDSDFTEPKIASPLSLFKDQRKDSPKNVTETSYGGSKRGFTISTSST